MLSFCAPGARGLGRANARGCSRRAAALGAQRLRMGLSGGSGKKLLRGPPRGAEGVALLGLPLLDGTTEKVAPARDGLSEIRRSFVRRPYERLTTRPLLPAFAASGLFSGLRRFRHSGAVRHAQDGRSNSQRATRWGDRFRRQGEVCRPSLSIAPLVITSASDGVVIASSHAVRTPPAECP